MQKTKSVKIGDQTFVVCELKVREIWELVNNQDTEKDTLSQYQDLLSIACPGITENDLLDMYPSEIDELWTAFKEANNSFLETTRRIGLDQALMEAVKEAVQGSIRRSAALFNMDTVQ